MTDFKNKPKMTEVYPFLIESIKDGGQFVLFPRGTSMLPTLLEGEDCVALEEIKTPVKYDIVLYRRKCGQFVLHRIMEIKNGKYTMCGDNQYIFEEGIEREQLIAVVREVRKKDGSIYDIEKIHRDGRRFHRMPRKVILRLRKKIIDFVKVITGEKNSK